MTRRQKIISESYWERGKQKKKKKQNHTKVNKGIKLNKRKGRLNDAFKGELNHPCFNYIGPN